MILSKINVQFLLGWGGGVETGISMHAQSIHQGFIQRGGGALESPPPRNLEFV